MVKLKNKGLLVYIKETFAELKNKYVMMLIIINMLISYLYDKFEDSYVGFFATLSASFSLVLFFYFYMLGIKTTIKGFFKILVKYILVTAFFIILIFAPFYLLLPIFKYFYLYIVICTTYSAYVASRLSVFVAAFFAEGSVRMREFWKFTNEKFYYWPIVALIFQIPSYIVIYYDVNLFWNIFVSGFWSVLILIFGVVYYKNKKSYKIPFDYDKVFVKSEMKIYNFVKTNIEKICLLCLIFFVCFFYLRKEDNIVYTLLYTPPTYEDIKKEEFWKKASLRDIKYIVNNSKKADKGFLLSMIVRFNNNIKIVKYLIEEGADVDYINYHKKPVLFYALLQEKPKDYIKTLVNAGANINVEFNNANLLMVACVNNVPLDVIKILINAGADVNFLSVNQMSATMACVEKYDDVNIVKYLKQGGADFNKDDVQGADSLIYAIRREDALAIDMTKEIIKYGAKIDPNEKILSNEKIVGEDGVVYRKMKIK